MKYWLFIIVFLFSSSLARGQAGQATEIVAGASNPITCNVARGWLFFNTVSKAMQTCTATNTWSAVGASGFPITTAVAVNSGGSITVNSGGSITTTGSGTITATGLSGTPALPNGTTATTQAALDNTTDVATDAFVTANGRGTGAGAEAIQGYTLSPFCPAANLAQCFNTPANTQVAVDCSWISGGTTATCASSHFTAADIGKRVFGFTSCNAFTSALASDTAAGAMTNTDGTGNKLTISAQTGTGITFTGGLVAHTVSGNTHCLIWGNPDDAGAALMDTAMQAAPFCPRALLIASNYMFTDPHFFTQPTACANSGTVQGGGTQGNVFYAAGFEIEGRGQGATIIYLTPTFPENSTCNHGVSASACFVRPLEGVWSNFQITGGQNANGVANTVLIEIDGPGGTDNFTCLNWGAASSGTTGWLVANWERFTRANNSGCGFTGMKTVSASGWTAYSLSIENSPIALNLVNAGVNTCYDCRFFESQFAAGTAIILNTGAAQINFYRLAVQNPAAIASVTGYLASTTAGSVLETYGGSFSTNTGTNSSGIKCSVACQSYIEGTGISASGSGNPYADVAGSILFDLGANNFVGGAGVSIGGKVSGSPSIGSLTSLATGNVVISVCGTSAATLFSGSSQKGQFTITYAGTPGTACTATVTFPTAFWTTPICTWQAVGGTNTLAALTLTNGATSATSTAVTLGGATLTAGNTHILQYNCTNP